MTYGLIRVSPMTVPIQEETVFSSEHSDRRDLNERIGSCFKKFASGEYYEVDKKGEFTTKEGLFFQATQKVERFIPQIIVSFLAIFVRAIGTFANSCLKKSDTFRNHYENFLVQKTLTF